MLAHSNWQHPCMPTPSLPCTHDTPKPQSMTTQWKIILSNLVTWHNNYYTCIHDYRYNYSIIRWTAQDNNDHLIVHKFNNTQYQLIMTGYKCLSLTLLKLRHFLSSSLATSSLLAWIKMSANSSQLFWKSSASPEVQLILEILLSWFLARGVCLRIM